MKRPQLKPLVAKLARLWPRRVLRWRYVLPRVAIVAAVVACVRFGLDPVLKFVIVASGETALGAKVDVADLSTSLLDGQITLSGLAATNPKKPLRNLAKADQMQLNVDLNALLRRRFVVTSGIVRGLKFDSERATSGALEPVDPAAEADAGPSMFEPVAAAAGDAADQWLANLEGRFTEDLESKLATPRVLAELEDRWKAQYEDLKVRADGLKAQAKQIESDFREVKKNPLRGAEQLGKLQQQLADTQAQLKTTLAELAALPAQAKADRTAVDAARKQDQEFLKSTIDIAKTDGGQLTQYLLGETAHGYVAESIGWVQYIRSWIPKTKMERPVRARGTNVHFVQRQRPKFLIERVALTGTARLGGQPLELTGLLTDATTEPALHQRPMQLHLVSGGAIGGDVLLTVDRRNGAQRDTLVIDCPRLALSERTLGRADRLAVHVAPGEASIAANLVLEGDELSGTIHLHQASKLAAATPAIRDDRIGEMIGESLSDVDRLEATIELAGTLRKPKFEIDSNLGPQLASGAATAARKYLTERRDRLVAKVQGQVDEQLAKLETRRNEAQQELMAKLGENTELVQQLGSFMNGGAGGGLTSALSIPQIGNALPRELIQR
jgi:uncharacterized protein (TIGR03545 family)